MSLFGGLFNYSKPGPGVDKNAPKKKRFFYFFELFGRKFWKLVELNLLYLLCCIPVVTIGPATCGLVYILRNFANEKPVFMVSDFFDAFKSNFKQGFVLGLLDILSVVLSGLRCCGILRIRDCRLRWRFRWVSASVSKCC